MAPSNKVVCTFHVLGTFTLKPSLSEEQKGVTLIYNLSICRHKSSISCRLSIDGLLYDKICVGNKGLCLILSATAPLLHPISGYSTEHSLGSCNYIPAVDLFCKPQLFLLLLTSDEDLAVIQQIRSLITRVRWSRTMHSVLLQQEERVIFSFLWFHAG